MAGSRSSPECLLLHRVLLSLKGMVQELKPHGISAGQQQAATFYHAVDVTGSNSH